MGKISKNELSESLKLEIENAGSNIEIVNDFSGGVDKAASAELAKTLNTQLAQKANSSEVNTALSLKTNETDFTTHKNKVVSKVAFVQEPYNQLTKTTVNLGFRPKSITINAVIVSTKYESIGYCDGTSQFCNYMFLPSLVKEIQGGASISFTNGSNTIDGSVAFTSTGIEITWTSAGTLPDATGNRRLIISAITH